MTYVKALHVVFVVCWFAGLFYLPRLFVYHAENETTDRSELLKTMERRLYRGIMTPSAALATVFGAWLIYVYWDSYVTAAWFWTKIALVVALFGYHGWCGQIVRQFASNRNQRSHVFYRVFNEAALLFLLAIIILAVAKPF